MRSGAQAEARATACPNRSPRTATPRRNLCRPAPQLRRSKQIAVREGDDSSADIYAKYLGAGRPATQKMPLEGEDRYDTAIEMSQQSFPQGARTLIIATGRNWPDALAGSALAGVMEAPVLLVNKALPDGESGWKLPDEIEAEIERLEPWGVYILGGTAAVSYEIEQALSGRGFEFVDRLGGADRYETACIIADEVLDYQGDEWDGTCFVTTGNNFPDALAASPLAAQTGYPILLSDREGLRASTRTCMDAMGVQGAIVLGGTVAVPLSVLAQLEPLGVTEIGRVGVTDRYATAAAIAEYGVDEFGMSMDTLGVATGQKFPDALTMGSGIGQENFVMMLTASTSLPGATKTALQANRDDISQVRFAGGTAAITNPVRSAIMACVY